MHAVFGTVLWVVCGVSIVAAVIMLVRSGKTWEEYGKNALLMDRDAPGGPPPGSAAAIAERDSEVRAMLEARNARRLRRGEAPIDVEQELARLTRASPQVDPALRAEIRDLVIARNHRRTRAGKPALDVEVEVEREIAALGDLDHARPSGDGRFEVG